MRSLKSKVTKLEDRIQVRTNKLPEWCYDVARQMKIMNLSRLRAVIERVQHGENIDDLALDLEFPAEPLSEEEIVWQAERLSETFRSKREYIQHEKSYRASFNGLKEVIERTKERRWN